MNASTHPSEADLSALADEIVTLVRAKLKAMGCMVGSSDCRTLAQEWTSNHGQMFEGRLILDFGFFEWTPHATIDQADMISRAKWQALQANRVNGAGATEGGVK
jgi:hypothetical protein